MKKEKKGYWYFTFPVQSIYKKKYVKLYGTYAKTKKKMFKHFRANWAFQYDEKQWIESNKSQAVEYKLTELNLTQRAHNLIIALKTYRAKHLGQKVNGIVISETSLSKLTFKDEQAKHFIGIEIISSSSLGASEIIFY